jgi:hypothetical protein
VRDDAGRETDVFLINLDTGWEEELHRVDGRSESITIKERAFRDWPEACPKDLSQPQHPKFEVR